MALLVLEESSQIVEDSLEGKKHESDKGHQLQLGRDSTP